MATRAPPPPPKMSKKAFDEEKKTVKYYLKIAMEAKDFKSLSTLIEKVKKEHFDVTDEVIAAAIKMLETLKKAEVESVKYYIKLGLQNNNYEALNTSLEMAEKLKEMGVDFTKFGDTSKQVQAAQEALRKLSAEKVEYVRHFLKQGLQLNNAEILDEALKMAHKIGIKNFEQKQIDQGKERLEKLKSIANFLDMASKQEDKESLELALKKAKELSMEESKEYKLADATHKRLVARGKSFFGGGWSGRRSPSPTAKHKSRNKLKRPMVFGVSLADSILASSKTLDNEEKVPMACYVCIEHIRQNGMTTEGIFRIPGNRDNMNFLMSKFEKNETSEVKFETVHDAAGVLKQYLRRLPEPLIPFTLYKPFLNVASSTRPNEPARVNEMLELLAKAPKECRVLLEYLCRFLKDLTAYEAITKMGVNNCAIVKKTGRSSKTLKIKILRFLRQTF